jgi:hypothetical protein
MLATRCDLAHRCSERQRASFFTRCAAQDGECPVVNNNPVSRCGGKNGLLQSPATGSFFQPTGKNETAPRSAAAGLRPCDSEVPLFLSPYVWQAIKVCFGALSGLKSDISRGP